MTRLPGGPLTTRRALFSHVEDIARFALVTAPPWRRTPRDLAFDGYLRQVRRILRDEPAEAVVVENRLLARSERSAITELTLRMSATVEPGDMLHVLWQNAPERTARHAPHLPAGAYWTTPLPHRPSLRRRYSPQELAASVFDLSGANAPADARELPRITPRFFTVSGVERRGQDALVRLQVTRVGTWPERAAAFLHAVEPGNRMPVRVLPHPHRVPSDAPGLAVVTGSGAAGVFSALRAGARGVQLLWGIGDKTLEPWVHAELDEHLATGGLAALRIVQTPERVPGALATLSGLPDLTEGWIYVSGNEDMGRDIDALLSGLLGRDALRRLSEQLRYIVST